MNGSYYLKRNTAAGGLDWNIKTNHCLGHGVKQEGMIMEFHCLKSAGSRHSKSMNL
jgi:hypothetical protein